MIRFLTLVLLLVTGCSSITPKSFDTGDGSVDTDTDVDTDVDSDTDTDTDSDSGADTDTDTDTEPDAGSCEDQDDFTLCAIVTDPDRSYDICIDEVCISPGCGDLSCNVPGPHFALADTNQRDCFDTTLEITCADPGDPFFGQDAQYGWDLSHGETERFSRDISSDPFVTDNVTGIVWQGCAAGLSGASCATGTAGLYHWDEALAYCDGLSLAGFEDWRLPDRFELQSIIDFGEASYVKINETAFPGIPVPDPECFEPNDCPSSSFWTSSFREEGTDSGLGIYGFDFGTGFPVTLSFDTWEEVNEDADPVLCVRGEPTPREERFVRDLTIVDYPVVIDNVTGLNWQGCVSGRNGDLCDTVWGEGQFFWEDVLAYCENLSWAGLDDWRVPNLFELASTVDGRKPTTMTMSDPKTWVDEFGENTEVASWILWSSTTRPESSDRGLVWDFFLNRIISVPKDGPSGGDSVRCVRGGS